MSAEGTLTVVTASFAVSGFVLAFLYQVLEQKGPKDWLEITARSLFILLQFSIWGWVIGFIVMESVFGVDFGGTK